MSVYVANSAAVSASTAVAEQNRRNDAIKKQILRAKAKEPTMTQQTLQCFVNKQVKIVDAFGNVIRGTLAQLTEDSAIIVNSRNTVVVAYGYIARLLTKNTY